MKCYLDEQHVNDDDDDDVKNESAKKESAQPVSDTFCGPVPELSRKLLSEHHECVRLLKGVYRLVNVPKRWYHRVATARRNMGDEESLMGPRMWTFRDENGVIRALCLVYVDDFMLACSDCLNGELGSLSCSHSAAHESHTNTWSGFEINFTEYVK